MTILFLLLTAEAAFAQLSTTKGICVTAVRFYDDISNDTYGIDGGLDAGWIRINLPWVLVEPRDDYFNWRFSDAVIDTANARGVNVLFVLLCRHPRFNIGNSPRTSSPPDDSGKWRKFVAAVVERYDDASVEVAYEVENEINSPINWDSSVASYILHLENTYNAIKDVNPNTIVVSGSLYCGALWPAPCSWIKGTDHGGWLTEIIQSGNYDAVGIHDYYRPDSGTDTCLPEEFNYYPPSFYGYIHYVNYLLSEAGQSSKLVFLTESGYDGNLGESIQANLLGSAWDDADSLGVDIKFYLCIRDQAQAFPYYYYGLVTEGGTKRASWTTFNNQGYP